VPRFLKKLINSGVFLTGVVVAFAARTATTAGTDVVTYHNDNARTGQNLNESSLTPATVKVSTFGKVGFFSTDGQVDAQPLYLSALSIPGQGARNVLYVATEHDSVYAFDADTGAVLWKVSLLGANETPSDGRGCSQVVPEIGITATPVLDRARGVIYVIAMSKTTAGAYVQRLHALNLTTGAELLGGPGTIQATFPGTGAGSSGGNVVFDPKQYEERSALLLMNGTVFTAWTSHCDIDPYTGWIMAYSASTLAQTSVLNVTPNGSRGAFWMAGAGPAADAAGNAYLLAGNGVFDTTLNGSGFPNKGDFGNAFLKISTSSGLSVADYFNMFNTVSESNADTDLGSGGALVLPDLIDGAGQTRHLAVGAGKDSHIYVVDRDSMGKWNATSNAQIYQDISGALSGSSVFSMPAYFDNTLYYGAVSDGIKAFPIANARIASTASSRTARSFTYPGATPGISAMGIANAILWAVENTNPAVLHAYDARDLTRELYNSSQAASGRDTVGANNKFITPTIVNGHVYVGTANGVAAFGLLVAPPTAPTNLQIR
jgi:outer membrane protein assembly factor BamB